MCIYMLVRAFVCVSHVSYAAHMRSLTKKDRPAFQVMPAKNIAFDKMWNMNNTLVNSHWVPGTLKRLGYFTLSSMGYFLLWAQWRTKSVSGTGFSESCTIASSSSAEKINALTFGILKALPYSSAPLLSMHLCSIFILHLKCIFYADVPSHTDRIKPPQNALQRHICDMV